MRILLSAAPDAGHTLPVLPLARAARRAGHEVAYLTDESMAEMVSPVPVLPVGPSFGEVRTEAGRGIVSGQMVSGPPPSPAGYNVTNGLSPEMLAELFVNARAKLSADEALTRARDFAPDLVVADELDVLGPLVASALDVPWASHAFGLVPEPAYRRALDTAITERLEERGLTATQRTAYLDLWPASLASDASAPAGDRIVIRPEPYRDEQLTWSAADFPGRQDRPLVLVTLGTTVRDVATLAQILRSVAACDVNVIATVASDAEAPEVDADRVRLVTFVPIDELMAGVSVVVSAAGAGTVLAPLARGIPAVLLPIVAEQPLNAARAAAAGAAVVVDGPDEVGDAVSRVLADPSYREAAQRVARDIAQMTTPQTALDTLIDRVARPGAVGRPTTSASPGDGPGPRNAPRGMPANALLRAASPTHLPDLVLPDSPDYDTARLAWNLHADQRPAAICVATRVEHVQAAIAYARAHSLRVAAQTTGHLAQNLPDLQRSLLLKLALHHGDVAVDLVARTARIEAGAVWGDVVDAVAPHGLAAMHGSSPSVGVMGYLLGGGLSFYGRAHGLAVNHVRAFEVVTPDGTVRRVDASHGAELFWALRGGGGGYAIVTAVELGLLGVPEVTGGALFFDIRHASRLLRGWRDWTDSAPDSVTTTFRILRLPPLPEVPEPLRAVPTVCIDGVSLDPAEGARLEQLLRGLAQPIMGGFGPMPSAAVVRLHGDPEEPVPAIGDGILLEKLDDEAIEEFLRVTGPGSPLLAAELRHLGGALASEPAGAGALGHLEGRFLLFGVGVPAPPSSAEELDAHLDRYLHALQPWATGTRFANYAERWSSLETCVPDSALLRLARVRAAVDPERLLLAPHLVPDALEGTPGFVQAALLGSSESNSSG